MGRVRLRLGPEGRGKAVQEVLPTGHARVVCVQKTLNLNAYDLCMIREKDLLDCLGKRHQPTGHLGESAQGPGMWL